MLYNYIDVHSMSYMYSGYCWAIKQPWDFFALSNSSFRNGHLQLFTDQKDSSPKWPAGVDW